MPEEQLQQREFLRTGTADSTSTSTAAKHAPSTSKQGAEIAMNERTAPVDGSPAAAAPQPPDTDGPAPPPRPVPPAEEADNDDFEASYILLTVDCTGCQDRHPI
jgi:hypothetical protein